METEKIEKKLKIEGEITSKQREFKRINAEVAILKDEVITLLNTKEKNETIIQQQRDTQKEILNEISEARLRWMQEKNKEQDEIEQARKEISKIIERSKELDAQEERIAKLTEKNTEVLKEKRDVLEKTKLELEAVKAERKQVEKDRKDFEKEIQALEQAKKDFKDSLIALVDKYGRNN